MVVAGKIESVAMNGVEMSDRKKSEYRGVSWFSKRDKWRAQITVGRKVVHLGCYELEECAALAYDGAARLVYGKKAKVNSTESSIVRVISKSLTLIDTCEEQIDELEESVLLSQAIIKDFQEQLNHTKGQLSITEALLAVADESLIRATEKKKLWWQFW
jgi:hypothetical protein